MATSSSTQAPPSIPSAADMRAPLVFAHANGFPAGCYRKLLDLLRTDFDVLAPELLGHAPAHPIGDGWKDLEQELLEYVRANCRGRRPWLVGHSLGGFLSLMLASHHPRLVRGVILLDAPVIAGWRAAVLWGLKRSGLIHRLHPAAPAARRRQEWSDLPAVVTHFEPKAVFARWDPDMLRDYAAAGTRDQAGRRRLVFEREREARIYATLPHHLGVLARRPPAVPVGFVGGTDSRELRLAGLKATQRLAAGHLRWIPGGSHLFPFEQPQATAEALLGLICELDRERPAQAFYNADFPA